MKRKIVKAKEIKNKIKELEAEAERLWAENRKVLEWTGPGESVDPYYANEARKVEKEIKELKKLSRKKPKFTTDVKWKAEYQNCDKDILIPAAGCLIDYDDVDHVQQLANVRLICGAPEMFFELQELIDYIDNETITKKAQKLINKIL